ncbi:MAG: D-alanyl-D-alanine carboxypeptidase/D-alanyl-D-alanine-endopeptidase [Acidimicrobiales bacterium]
MRRWVLPLVLGAVCLAAGLLAVAPRGDPGVAPAPAVLAPVLSARRVPAVMAQVVADQRLRSVLDATLADPALGAARGKSCLVVRQGSRAIVVRRADFALIPASTLKVLTAQAVVARIGAEERFVTEARTAVPVAADGTVAGDLWVVGGGDPLLATADYAASFPNQPQVITPFERLADTLVEAGVRVVGGAVIGDESRYDTQRYLPTWKPSYREDGDVGPSSALAVNDGFVTLPPRPVAAEQPAIHTAGVLTTLLQARGVRVGGAPGRGVAPAGSVVVAALPSPPVGVIVAQMLRESDNVTAESLTKELGYRFEGTGTTAAGVRVIRQTVADAGVEIDGLASVDGSGLDRSDRATCASLLASLGSSGPEGVVAAGFPVAARDGTLAMRFVGHPAAGRLRAKTGSLSGVAGLAGFVDPATPGVPLSFALLANELPRDSLGRRLQEDLAAALARYPDAPPLDSLGPRR